MIFPYRVPRVLPLLVSALLAAACGGPWRDGYFNKGVNRLTQDEVTEKLGPPHTAKTPALGGDSIWTYRVPITERELSSLHFSGLSNATKQATSLLGKAGEGPKEILYCYRYTLTFNEQKVLKQWKREECVPGTREALLQNE
ncbi:conserved exported protein of unknown function [Nitrospira japonica]|uniref:Lipoprotein SmpA/OmlA domain-containing protein n=1 Tax=Nitrospira japonica TaxID=1325564 RepID=A0A1W1I285_9BACT|nr:hypothetical protein [Nitrospira japonica]SLM47126.1 conserved exported protein of unknown function [Nitrospira japonica]